MTNQQLYLAIGIPMLFDAGLIGILLAYINAKFSGVDHHFIGVDQRFAALEQTLDRRFAAVDKRFDDLRDLWRAELHGVEEVLDARLKQWEER
jgi:hypothetical protein